MIGWVIRCRGINWECSTEQDALGVLLYLRDYGRPPLGTITIEGASTQALAQLLATLPGQSQPALL